ncbi:MAG TPA: hypothetical protein VKG45_00135 [Actinomycetes bacterium]|nr:hypothetical protein [Actinomycetes bacterium]
MALQDAWDPDNFFRRNRHLRPSA